MRPTVYKPSFFIVHICSALSSIDLRTFQTPAHIWIALVVPHCCALLGCVSQQNNNKAVRVFRRGFAAQVAFCKSQHKHRTPENSQNAFEYLQALISGLTNSRQLPFVDFPSEDPCCLLKWRSNESQWTMKLTDTCHGYVIELWVVVNTIQRFQFPGLMSCLLIYKTKYFVLSGLLKSTCQNQILTLFGCACGGKVKFVL